MIDFPIHSGTVGLCLIVSFCFLGAIVTPAIAADANIQAELGSTLNLHGISFKGDRIYLFLTGPGLPANGVTLTDTSQRADQGQFTIVDVDSGQEWAYKWNTARIQNEIDPGTYLVYATNEPVDKAHLGGSDSYKTLEVYLTESVTLHSGSSDTTYKLNPEEHSSIVVNAPTLALTTATPVITSPPVPLPTPVPTTLPPTTKASLLPGITLLAVLIGAGFVQYVRRE